VKVKTSVCAVWRVRNDARLIKLQLQAHHAWASEGFFSGEDQQRIFPKFFPGGGPKAVKFVFYPSKLKKQPVFANTFKIQGGLGSPSPPSDAHA